MADISGAENQNLAEADVQLGPRTFQQYHSLRTSSSSSSLSCPFPTEGNRALACELNTEVFPDVACPLRRKYNCFRLASEKYHLEDHRIG